MKAGPVFCVAVLALASMAMAHEVQQLNLGDVVPRPCRRLSRYQVFFQGTDLETKVDVGVCDGGCGSDFKCKVGLAISSP
jgi:hypothetical protein